MKRCTTYSDQFKEKLLAKVFSPNAPSRLELARRAGIPYTTLVGWVYMSQKKQTIKSVALCEQKPGKSAQAKLQAVFDTFEMTAQERGSYCRKQGLYTHDLDEWKARVLAELNNGKHTLNKGQKTEHRQLAAENKQLKHELNRKEKALVEASALLLLKKKANLIWGDSADD